MRARRNNRKINVCANVYFHCRSLRCCFEARCMVLKGFKKPLIPPCKPPCPLGLPLHLPWHFQIHHPTKVPQIHSRNLRSYETWPGHHAHHRKVQNHTVCNKFENFVITVNHHSIFMKHSPVWHLYCHFASSLKNVSYPTSRLDF